MEFEESTSPGHDPWSHGADFSGPVGDLEKVSEPRAHRPLRWGLSAGLVMIVLVAVIIVDSRPTTKSAILVLSQASARTTGSSSARLHATETLTFEGKTAPVLEVDGTKDFAHASGQFTVMIGVISEQVRVVAGVSYLSVPGVALPRGAHWVSFSAADLKQVNKVASSVDSDPSTGLQFLSAVDGNPRLLERGQLDGVDVTHYAFTLDLQSYFDRLRSASTSANLPGFAQSLEQASSLIDLSRLPGEAWIDGDGRVRRFDLDFDVAQQGQSGKVYLDMRFSDFDQPVIVPAPPASDTVPFREVPNLFSEIGNAARNAA